MLDLHGWGSLHEDLHRMSRRQQWAEMSELITDDVLNTFAVVGTAEEIDSGFDRRYGDVVTRLSPSKNVLRTGGLSDRRSD